MGYGWLCFGNRSNSRTDEVPFCFSRSLNIFSRVSSLEWSIFWRFEFFPNRLRRSATTHSRPCDTHRPQGLLRSHFTLRSLQLRQLIGFGADLRLLAGNGCSAVDGITKQLTEFCQLKKSPRDINWHTDSSPIRFRTVRLMISTSHRRLLGLQRDRPPTLANWVSQP